MSIKKLTTIIIAIVVMTVVSTILVYKYATTSKCSPMSLEKALDTFSTAQIKNDPDLIKCISVTKKEEAEFLQLQTFLGGTDFNDTVIKAFELRDAAKNFEESSVEKSDLKVPQSPQKETTPAAPTVSYEALYVSDEGVGYDQIFALESRGEDTMGQAINYQSKAGRVNVMEQVVEDVELTGYVHIDHAYKFADQYVLIVSTGEHGNSCPATTYAFSYDTKSESVTGKTEIDGCSENVQAFAEGNKLTVKKDGKATTIYNGKV